MHYKAAYLYLFNALSDLIKLLESTDASREEVNVEALLRHAQVEQRSAAQARAKQKNFKNLLTTCCDVIIITLNQ